MIQGESTTYVLEVSNLGGPTLTHQRELSRGGVSGVCPVSGSWGWSAWQLMPHAGMANASPFTSTAHAMRAFFAAIATTAFQEPTLSAKAIAQRLMLSVLPLAAFRTARAPARRDRPE